MKFRASSVHLLTTAVFAAAAVLGVCYALLVPLGEKPDEPSHLVRVVHLVWYGVDPCEHDYEVFPSIVGYEAIQPPAYYLMSAQILSLLPEVSWVLEPSPLFRCVEGSPRFVVSGPTKTEPPLQVIALRLIGLLMLLLSGVLVFWSARELLGNSHLAIAAGSLQLLLPQMLFICTGVSNDCMAVLLGSTILSMMVLAGRRGGYLSGIFVGLASGLALSVKLSTIVYLIAAPVVLVAWQRRNVIRVVASHTFGLFAAAAFGIVFAGSTSLVDVSWFLRKLLVKPVILARKEYVSSFTGIVSSYWAQFGWMDIDAVNFVRIVWVVLLVATTLGWAVGRRKTKTQMWPLAFVLSVVCCGWMLTLGSSHQIQGRFFFPFSGIIGILIVRGLMGFGSRNEFFSVIPLLLVTVNVISIIQLKERYAPTELPSLGMTMDARQCYSDRIVLRTLSQGGVLGQSFLCDHAGLCAIDVVFTGEHDRSASVEIEVVDCETGHIFRKENLEISRIVTERYTRFRFDPIVKSGGRGMLLRLCVRGDDREGTLSLRYALEDLYVEGVRLEEGEPREGDLKFVVWCQSRFDEEAER